ncbi:hypothetical protein GEMRC1_005645 [Eukaryota sp. GEM-RC1]
MKEVALFYFRKTQPQPSDLPEGKVSYTCQRCPNISVSILKNKGYANLMTHINKYHKNYVTEMAAANGDITTYVHRNPEDKAQNLFGWLEWCITEVQPFNFVEKDCVRRNSFLQPIARQTLKKYFNLLHTELCCELSSLLPSKFGLMFDGWRHPSLSIEFIGMLAAVPKSDKLILLSLFPFEVDDVYSEDNVFNPQEVLLGAEQYISNIDTVTECL